VAWVVIIGKDFELQPEEYMEEARDGSRDDGEF
jgi:hypothetical protein